MFFEEAVWDGLVEREREVVRPVGPPPIIRIWCICCICCFLVCGCLYAYMGGVEWFGKGGGGKGRII